MGSFLVNSVGAGNGFQAQGAKIQGQDFENKMAGAEDQYANTWTNQNNLASVLQQQALGRGPSPENEMLKGATENAIKQNAGMLASQKGINPAIAQRIAAQNAAGMSQEAAGQGALMGLNKQLRAQDALQNLYGTQANQANTQQSTLQNALGAYNNAQVGMTSNMNNVNAGVAGQNAAAAQKAVGGLLGGAASSLFAKGGEVGEPTQHFDAGGPVISNWGYGLHPQLDSGASLANSYIDSGGEKHDGGMQKGFSDFAKGAGQKANPAEMQTDAEAQAGYNQAAQQIGYGAETALPAAEAAPAVGEAAGEGGLMDGALALFAARGGQVPKPQMMAEGGDIMGSVAKLIPLALMALKDGGEVPDHFHQMASIYHPEHGERIRQLKAQGGQVPGTPNVNRNDYKNDVVPAMLTPKEIVLPLSVTQSENPPQAAADFVAAQLRKKHEPSDHTSDFHDALTKAIGSRRSK